jgi:hypothetical protein
MTKLVIVIALASLVCLAGTTVDVNGGFERCSAGGNGILTPVGWNLNRAISKNCSARATLEKDEVRTGNFSLNLECEEDDMLYFRTLDQFPVNAGDKMRFRVFARGEGTFRIMLLMMHGPGLSYTLRTIGGLPDRKVADDEKWVEIVHEITMIPVKTRDNKQSFTKLWFLPMIYINGEADIFLDDLSIEVIPKEDK